MSNFIEKFKKKEEKRRQGFALLQSGLPSPDAVAQTQRQKIAKAGAEEESGQGHDSEHHAGGEDLPDHQVASVMSGSNQGGEDLRREV